ncbi:hypothetical protein BKA67DRAFT_587701 [Truncatella angustata]|uniref:Uncharacterized protein n=1 Tax=Truncatella angustata TaxID=152316 RepID=A0A9P8RF40_9PEZI|nr:uncharacterized protein BKA67DRAFT_587701 [Truncatella angustata]KAH6643443.1 hypothetical protein BKA67DRAFT_587701 [Truncatella angustata]
MFGFQPPQLSQEEIRELEDAANFTIKSFAGAAVALYFCTSFVMSLVSSPNGVADPARQPPS